MALADRRTGGFHSAFLARRLDKAKHIAHFPLPRPSPRRASRPGWPRREHPPNLDATKPAGLHELAGHGRQIQNPPFDPEPTLDDYIRQPERIDTLSLVQLHVLAPKIAKRAAQIRDIESRILFRLLCQRNADIESDGFPRLLNPKQLAERLSVPESWVREQARLGNLPSIKMGHYLRFRLDDIKIYLIVQAHPEAGYDIPDRGLIRLPLPFALACSPAEA